MSKKSSIPLDLISLPKGGGAVTGISESFSPDLFTGTGNLTIPLQLPPGRNGLNPSLALRYSTGRGNGVLGLGWYLNLPDIYRKTSRGVPTYDDQRDTFVSSESGDLAVVNAQTAGESTYRPVTEGWFSKLTWHRSSIDNYWSVHGRDGTVTLFGQPGSAGHDDAVIAADSRQWKAFKWRVSKVIDVFGNEILFRYRRRASDDSHPLLECISYSQYDNAGSTFHLAKVDFGYEHRTDVFHEYRPGFAITTASRLTSIAIHTLGGDPTKQYDLTYLDKIEERRSECPLNGISLLARVTLSGRDGQLSESLPPMEFAYTQFEPHGRKFFAIEGPDLPSESLAASNIELVDLFGDGLPDLVQLSGATSRYWRNRGGGRFDHSRPIKDIPSHADFVNAETQFIDANGDGLADVYVAGVQQVGYYPSDGRTFWSNERFKAYREAPAFSLTSPSVRLIDLDGDGLTDILRSGTRLECYFNDAFKGWYRQRFVNRSRVEVFPDVDLSNARVFLAPMAGSGLQDIVLIADRLVQYWPNLGHGNWGERITMFMAPRLPRDLDPKRILIGDIDGDGHADIVVVDDRKVTAWINQSGRAWSEPIEILGTPALYDTDSVRLVDVLGSGVGGILWSYGAGHREDSRMFFLDLLGGNKPYLLSSVQNHLGATTKISYMASTAFYLSDAKQGHQWQTMLPFPVHVVHEVRVTDKISGGELLSEYRYHHGCWDGIEREFRGFARVDRLDAETFGSRAGRLPGEKTRRSAAYDLRAHSPPMEVRTWFHLGAAKGIGDAGIEPDWSAEFWGEDPTYLTRPPEVVALLRELSRNEKRMALRSLGGQKLRQETYAIDGTGREERPISVGEWLPGLIKIPSTDAASGAAYFAPLLASRVSNWLRGQEPSTRFEFYDHFTDHGLPQVQMTIGVPRGRDYRRKGSAGQPYLATLSALQYATPLGPIHIHDRVCRARLFEVRNTGEHSALDLWKLTRSNPTPGPVLNETLKYYDGPGFVGLPFGQVQEFGRLSRVLELAFTDSMLSSAYTRSDDGLTHAIPPYLLLTSSQWPSEYPATFKNDLASNAGYVYHAPDREYAGGWYSNVDRRQYQDSYPGLVANALDVFGRRIEVSYDARTSTFPVKVVDVTGLITLADYDYRTLKPALITDPNESHTRIQYSPLGLVSALWRYGNNGDGDLHAPSVRYEYAFNDYETTGQPLSATTVQRVYHDSDELVPPSMRNQTITTAEYSDGFGRVHQRRQQAEGVTYGDQSFGDSGLPADPSQPNRPAIGAAVADRVLVLEWKRYNNKGQVTEAFEPYFTAGWAYAEPATAQLRAKTSYFYEADGELICTQYPDGSEKRIVRGVLENVTRPQDVLPSPWEAHTYDGNDNAGRTHPSDTSVPSEHHDTPESIEVDAFGRAIKLVRRINTDPVQSLQSISRFDLRANLVEIVDSAGRSVFEAVYDCFGRRLRQRDLDAGVRRFVFDAGGNEVERRDSKGSIALRSFDNGSRPVLTWARDTEREDVTLREKLVYGDAVGGGATRYLKGRLCVHYDEAGRLIVESYDFKGNPVDRVRNVIKSAQILGVFTSLPVKTYRVQWEPPSGTDFSTHESNLLETTDYRTTLTYDALSRAVSVMLPKSVDRARHVISSHYNEGGLVRSLSVDGREVLREAGYNAKGQRTIAALGNGIMVRRSYETGTFRLLRQRAEHYSNPDPMTFKPSAQAALLDIAYRYDLVGNVRSTLDTTPGSGLPHSPNRLDRSFRYDPLYRLTNATGRECIRTAVSPWVDIPKCTDPNRTREYRQTLSYDEHGNLIEQTHVSMGGGYTRTYEKQAESNRVQQITQGPNSWAFTYDGSGNILTEGTDRVFEWDWRDRLRAFRSAHPISNPSIYTHYLYDASGRRVMKVTRRANNRVEIAIYVDDLFEHIFEIDAATVRENNNISVLDHGRRIARIRIGAAMPGDRGPAFQYSINDQVASCVVVVDYSGVWANREEYYPFGTTSFGGFARKRYRFNGRERDRESGLYYFGHRYLTPWNARWLSCDPDVLSRPITDIRPRTLYAFGENNPIRYRDPNGQWVETAVDVASLTWGVQSFVQNVREGNTGDAIVDAIGIVADTAAVILPLVPGIAGASIKVIRQSDKLVDAAKVVEDAIRSSEGAGLIKEVGRLSETAKAAQRAEVTTTVAKAGEKSTELSGVASGAESTAMAVERTAVSSKPSMTARMEAVRAVDRVLPTPKVSDAKLQNLVNDLYKGTTNPRRVGTGTTADAVRNELLTGQPTSGTFHIEKGENYIRALENWLNKNPGASKQDRMVGESLLLELKEAFGSRK